MYLYMYVIAINNIHTYITYIINVTLYFTLHMAVLVQVHAHACLIHASTDLPSSLFVFPPLCRDTMNGSCSYRKCLLLFKKCALVWWRSCCWKLPAQTANRGQ